MARRKDHTHIEVRDMALAAARKIVARKGLAALTARAVAERIGYSTGMLYKVFSDFDDLLVQMNNQTLDELHGYLTANPLPADTESALQLIARRYIDFTMGNAPLWNAVFDPWLLMDSARPPPYTERVNRLFGLLKPVLAPLFSDANADELFMSIKVLWSSLHGICVLFGAGALEDGDDPMVLVNNLIANYVAGLQRQVITSSS